MKKLIFSILIILSMFFSTSYASSFSNWERYYAVDIPDGYHIQNWGNSLSFSAPDGSILHSISLEENTNKPYDELTEQEKNEMIQYDLNSIPKLYPIPTVAFVKIKNKLGYQMSINENLIFTFVIFNGNRYQITSQILDPMTSINIFDAHNSLLSTLYFVDIYSNVNEKTTISKLHNFSGTWHFPKQNGGFSIIINQGGKELSGTINAVAYNGRKIERGTFNGVITADNKAIIYWKGSFDLDGTSTLQIDPYASTKATWTITSTSFRNPSIPTRESYIPKEAILTLTSE